MKSVVLLPSHLKLQRLTSSTFWSARWRGLFQGRISIETHVSSPFSVGQWCRSELQEFLADYLVSLSSTQRGLFRPNNVANLVSAHQSGAAWKEAARTEQGKTFGS